VPAVETVAEPEPDPTEDACEELTTAIADDPEDEPVVVNCAIAPVEAAAVEPTEEPADPGATVGSVRPTPLREA
jgi:hypothetical protein